MSALLNKTFLSFIQFVCSHSFFFSRVDGVSLRSIHYQLLGQFLIKFLCGISFFNNLATTVIYLLKSVFYLWYNLLNYLEIYNHLDDKASNNVFYVIKNYSLAF